MTAGGDREPRHRALSVGIDLGTSGCRAIAIDRDRQVVAMAQSPIEAPQRDGDSVRQDPELWWQAVTRTLTELTGDCAPSAIQGLCVDGTSATLVLTDEAGDPVAPARMYNDASARDGADDIARAAPDQAWLGASSSLAKLIAMTAEPGASRAKHALHQADWIAGRLTSRFGLADENNVLKLGYDAVSRHWPRWIDRLGVDTTLLPSVVPVGSELGRLAPGIASSLGLNPDTRVFAGTTDSTAAALAAGARQPGDAVTSLGSTLVMKVVTRRPVFAASHGIYSHRLGELWLAGGASNSGGAVLRQFFSQQRIDALTAQLQPDLPTGLDYYPLPQPGERFPHPDPGWPVRLEPRPTDDLTFFQGMLEGMAAIEATAYNVLTGLGADRPTRILSAGGGSHNPGWTRIRARVTGLPIEDAHNPHAAYGAALLAQRGAQPI